MNPIMNSNTQYAFIPEPQESPELPHPIIIIVEGSPNPSPHQSSHSPLTTPPTSAMP